MPTQPPPPFPPASDQPQWAGLVARAINQLEDRVDARLGLFHEELALLRQSGAPVEPAPPTVRQKVVSGTGKLVQALGVLTLLAAAASQLAAALKPELVGPIDAFAAFLRGLAQ